MRTYNTVNDIKSETEALFQSATGKRSLSASQMDIVYSSIVDSFQLVLMEYGVERFRFQEEDDTLTTTSGTAYVDLDEYVYHIKGGTVRIPSQNQMLSLIDERDIFRRDPNLEETGVPTHYYYDTSDDPNIIRMALWPTPDAAYSISLVTLKFPADTITEFPVVLNMAIKSKAKELACIGLGMASYSAQFRGIYEEAIAKVKDGYENDGPRHVGRRISAQAGRPIWSESRIRE